MSRYKAKPIDFDGCHHVIAEHLKRGEAVLCKVGTTGKTDYVIGYNKGDGCKYVVHGNAWICAEPIETKLYWKKASDNMAWLEENRFAHGPVLFNPKEIVILLLRNAGKEMKDGDDFYPAAWFEER